jgi:DNA (cytosine-5)-methyltransferase 1
MLTYGSVCSGIEAASVAWETLGWKPSFFSEIENFPRLVLRTRWPDVPLHGDFTTINRGHYAAINVLIGGTPCQDFSVAGLRKGLAGKNGNLAIEYIRLAERLNVRWILWENVPGVLSNDKGRAFGTFLAEMGKCGYGTAYRVFDAQYFGVPQQRRRVFVVGYLGDWRPAAAVLFERESLCGDITPRRETEEGAAGTGGARTCLSVGADDAANGHLVAPTLDARSGRSVANGFATSGGLVAGTLEATAGRSCGAGTPLSMLAFGGGNCSGAINVSAGLNAKSTQRQDFETETLIAAVPINMQIATRHRAMGEKTGMGIGEVGDPAYTVQAQHGHAVAYNVTFCDANGTRSDRPNGGLYVNETDSAKSLTASGDMSTYIAGARSLVRRLTPRECERLQGFPDDYTLVKNAKGKLVADTPRYKAIGNSMAVPVIRWLGERIQKVDSLL